MAKNVILQVLGGEKKVIDNVSSVSELKKKVALEGAYTFLVDGEPASENQILTDGVFVTASQAVKGGK